jgi:transcriptional regulator with XRE-family HTH domain
LSHTPDYQVATIDLIVKDLGARLARVRLARNVSQEALADKAGITRRTLSRLETGQGATLDTLVRVLRGLGLESHLEALLPDPGIQPIHRTSAKTPERKRARATAADKAEPWRWGEDQTS